MGYSSMPAGLFSVVVLMAIWSIIWKGIALWKAARNGSKPWYIIMLVVNTVGILEILYIFFLIFLCSKNIISINKIIIGKIAEFSLVKSDNKEKIKITIKYLFLFSKRYFK